MLEVCLLGPLRVTDGGGYDIPPGERLRALLAVLALRAGEPVSQDRLIGELALDESTRNASNTLHAHVMRLRKWLGARFGARDLLATRGDSYLLDLPAARVDAHRFAAAARDAAAGPAAQPDAVVAVLEPALRLWRGPALCDAGDGPVCRRAASALTDQRLATQERLADARLAIGQETQAIADIEHLIADHPFRERLWEQLMLALYRCGRQVDAVESYHQVRSMLSAELGLEPGPGLRTRLQQILNQDPVLVGAPY